MGLRGVRCLLHRASCDGGSGSWIYVPLYYLTRISNRNFATYYYTCARTPKKNIGTGFNYI